jgi:HPt (histidine-containing phosphotransfer) domain-containing protein
LGKGSKSLLTIEPKRGALIAFLAARFTRLSELRSNHALARDRDLGAGRGEGIMTKHENAADFRPVMAEVVLDEEHLKRMTLGDQSLEREVLQVFIRQITLMLKRIARAEPAQAAAAAHTLKGSASGLGAWRVANAAERLERAAAGLGDLSVAVAELEGATREVCGVIEARLEHAGKNNFRLFGATSGHAA